MKAAVPATRAEAEAAYQANAASVYRSKNSSLHRQYWALDPGTGGGPPPIYKSGKTFIIAHDLEGPNLPPPHAEPIEADEGAESENVRAMGEHLDARLRAKSSIPAAAPAPGTSGMAHGPTLDSSGGVATAPTMPRSPRPKRRCRNRSTPVK